MCYARNLSSPRSTSTALLRDNLLQAVHATTASTGRLKTLSLDFSYAFWVKILKVDVVKSRLIEALRHWQEPRSSLGQSTLAIHHSFVPQPSSLLLNPQRSIRNSQCLTSSLNSRFSIPNTQCSMLNSRFLILHRQARSTLPQPSALNLSEYLSLSTILSSSSSVWNPIP
jgi:hypothetical protein